jgi:hypothetical protein
MPLVIAATARTMRGAQCSCRQALGWFASLVVEFKRAIAAEQRYHDLKRASPPTVIGRDAVARRIFEELYSSTADAGAGQRCWQEKVRSSGDGRNPATPRVGRSSGNGV